jgi:putative heme-binding domain-containing protein
MHIVSDERDFLPSAIDLLTAGVRDENPRVRLEAVRGLSFFPTLSAAKAALAALKSPTDSWIEYTLEHTLAALEPQWQSAYQSGELTARDDRAKQFIDKLIAQRAPSALAQGQLSKLINPETPERTRNRAYSALEKMHGDADNGRSVFTRLCVSCHKVGDTGYTFGPDLSDVGKRLKRHEILESIIEPSKKVDPKYVTTTIITSEGKALVGFIITKTKESVTLLMAEGKQATIPTDEIDEVQATNQSSMPENLASTLAPAEFLDVVEFLSSRK